MIVTDGRLKDELDRVANSLISLMETQTSAMEDKVQTVRDDIAGIHRAIADNDSKMLGSFSACEHKIETMDKDFTAVTASRHEHHSVFAAEIKHEIAILTTQVEMLTKIVCHLSGAKGDSSGRDSFADEILRRLAKLEGPAGG